jgi:hypothetical protein
MACTGLYLSVSSNCLFSYDELDFQFSEGLAHKSKNVDTRCCLIYALNKLLLWIRAVT